MRPDPKSPAPTSPAAPEKLLACTCPECGGSTRSALEDPSRKSYQPGCTTCGGLGLNRHVEAA